MRYIKYLMIGIILLGLSITYRRGANVSNTSLERSTSSHFTPCANSKSRPERNLLDTLRVIVEENNPYDIYIYGAIWGCGDGYFPWPIGAENRDSSE